MTAKHRPIGNLVQKTVEAVRPIVEDGFVLLGFLVLFSLYIFKPILRPNFFVQIPNVILIGASLTVVSLAFIGWRAMRRTPIDLLFCVWALLAVFSHVWAQQNLNRGITEFSLYTYIVFIISAWAGFRAGYAVVRVNPRFGPYALLIAIIFTLLASAAIAVLQTMSAFQKPLLDLAQRATMAEGAVAEGVLNERPTGMFAGPNLLGYANDLGAICLVGIGSAYARNAKPFHVALIMAGLGIFGYSTLISQSRSSLAVFVLILLAYGLILRRFKASPQALAVYVLLMLGVGGVGAYAFQVSKFEYVTGTFQNSLTKDESLVVRQKALEQVANMAGEIAPLGSGMSHVNQLSFVSSGGYDPYWTFTVDNEWANSFLAHGVLGPILIGFFYLISFKAAARARKSSLPAGRTMGYVATACLITNLAISFSAVRIAKYETAIYTFAIVGACFAVSDVRQRRPQRAPQPAPSVPAAS